MSKLSRQAKRIFLRELIDNVKREILDAVEKMPEEWDGHELRAFVAYRFKQADFVRMPRSRKHAFNNEILVRNL